MTHVQIPELRVVIVRDQASESLVAHCVDYPILAWAATDDDLQKKFKSAVAGYVHCEAKEGVVPFKEPAKDIAKYRKMWDEGKSEPWFDIDIKSVSSKGGENKVDLKPGKAICVRTP